MNKTRSTEKRSKERKGRVWSFLRYIEVLQNHTVVIRI